MSEPRFGYKNLIKAKKAGKVKAFVNILVPTETVGHMEISGFKVIEGESGCFLSLPNRAVEVNTPTEIVTATGDRVQGVKKETKYYNNIRFESQEKYNEFRNALNKEVLPLILKELAKK